MKLIDLEIEDKVLVCPYCMSPSEGKLGCCGESSTHFEEAYLLSDGLLYTIEEYDKLIDNVNLIDS